jgi:hypothetical protein
MTQTTGPDGKHGTHVAMPMTYSKEGKKGTDRHGCNCLVWDLVVNPACIATAAATPRMMATLAEMVRLQALLAAIGHLKDACVAARCSRRPSRSWKPPQDLSCPGTTSCPS